MEDVCDRSKCICWFVLYVIFQTRFTCILRFTTHNILLNQAKMINSLPILQIRKQRPIATKLPCLDFQNFFFLPFDILLSIETNSRKLIFRILLDLKQPCYLPSTEITLCYFGRFKLHIFRYIKIIYISYHSIMYCFH